MMCSSNKVRLEDRFGSRQSQIETDECGIGKFSVIDRDYDSYAPNELGELNEKRKQGRSRC